MGYRIFTTSTFARKLGFKDARDGMFKRLLKLAAKRGLIKIGRSGFRSDSKNHSKLVVLMRPLEEVEVVKRTLLLNDYYSITIIKEGKLENEKIKDSSKENEYQFEAEEFSYLSKTEKRYLEALAMHSTVKDAALALGVSPRTLYNWCYNFRKRYEAKRGWINSVLNYKRKSGLIARILSRRVPLEETVEEEEW